MYSWNSDETAVTDRLVQAIAPARIAAACALGGYALLWEHASSAETTLMLAIAAVMAITALVQIRRPRSSAAARVAVFVDSAAALGALWAHSTGHARLFFGPLLLVMIEGVTLIPGQVLRRRAQDAVVESERRLRTVTDNITDVIFVYGMDHRLQWVAPSIEGLTGFTAAELFERNTLNDVHPDDAPRMLELWRSLFKGESYTGAEFRFTTRAGEERWCWSAGNPVYDSDNTQTGVQIRDADITLRKHAELRLRESVQHSRAIIETTSDAFVSAAGDGTIQEWNRAAEHMFSLQRSQAIGATLLDVIPAESSREPLEHALAGLRSGGEATIELVAHRADGTPFAAEVRLWMMHVDGAVTLNTFLRDITERKRREEQVAFMAYHDPLTGLPNRAMLEQHLDLVLLRARHDETAAALLFLDIDRFKHVNDTYGHDAGDQLLCETATRLRSAARAGDLVVRLGGDEFVLVLGDLPAAAAADIATAVASRVHLELRAPYRLDGVKLQTSTSVGIAIFPGDGADATSLLNAADSGMYASKRAGRGGTSFALGSRWAA